MKPVALDSSSLIGYLNGRVGGDTTRVREALAAGRAVVPPLVVAEVFSLPGVPEDVIAMMRDLVQLPLLPGYWERAGQLRGRVLAGRRRARMADTLIAQSCIDHDVPLVSADSDFRHFVAFGLRLLD
jgi:predicted nucleic acid-binding protein